MLAIDLVSWTEGILESCMEKRYSSMNCSEYIIGIKIVKKIIWDEIMIILDTIQKKY